MSDSMKFRLPNPDPISIRELEARGRKSPLESTFEVENIPETAADIARLIHEAATESRLSSEDLSHEAQFVNRLDADIRQFCDINKLQPVPTMEQFADIVAGSAAERKIPEGFALNPDNFRKFHDFLAERYAIGEDSAEFVQDPEGPKRQERTVRAAERRAVTDAEGAARGFWGTVYRKMLQKADEESLPQRLKTRLENIVDEMDAEVREQRLESLAQKIGRFPAERMVPVYNALYESVFAQPVRGKTFDGKEREAFLKKLSAAAESIRPATEAGKHTEKKLLEAMSDLTKRQDGFDRADRKGALLAYRRVQTLLTAYGSVIEEPFALMKSGDDLYSGERIANKLVSFTGPQRMLFLTALQDRLEEVETDEDLRQSFKKLVDSFKDAQRSEATLRAWGDSCADFLNEVMTRPEIPAPQVIEAVTPDSVPEVEIEQPATADGKSRSERIVLDSPQNILTYLRAGGKKVQVMPAVKAALKLDTTKARELFRALAPFVLERGGVSVADLPLKTGITYKKGEIDQIRDFIRQEGVSASGGLRGWEAFFLIARRTREFKRG